MEENTIKILFLHNNGGINVLTLLTNVKEYIRNFAYPQNSFNNNMSLHEYYDTLHTENGYVNGHLYINENPINTFQTSFMIGINAWIDVVGSEYSSYDFIIETNEDYSILWDKMEWYVDGKNTTPTSIDKDDVHVLNFKDLRENNSLVLKVESFVENNNHYKGFSKEYINDFVEKII